MVNLAISRAVHLAYSSTKKSTRLHNNRPSTFTSIHNYFKQHSAVFVLIVIDSGAVQQYLRYYLDRLTSHEKETRGRFQRFRKPVYASSSTTTRRRRFVVKHAVLSARYRAKQARNQRCGGERRTSRRVHHANSIARRQRADTRGWVRIFLHL